MSLQELYQEIILDHGRHPRNFGPLPESTHSAAGYNPLCGDRVHLYMKVQEDQIQDIAFEGAGCAICMASASLMTERLRGEPAQTALATFTEMQATLTGERDTSDDLGDLACLAGVRQFPSRIKCALLPWHALREALTGSPEEAPCPSRS